MPWLSQMVFRVKSLCFKPKLDEQLSEEIRTHVQMATEANVAAGMSPEEARYAALREFGNVASIQERTRDERGWVWLELILRDIRLAAYSLWRSPGFTSAAVATLALGIASVAIVALLFDTMVLTYAGWLREPSRVVAVISHPIDQPTQQELISWPALQDWRTHNKSFSHLAGYAANGGALSAGGRHDWEFGAVVSDDLFETLGVQAFRGRTLIKEDFEPDAPRVLVISHKLWLDRFGGADDVVGQTAAFNSVQAVVVGIMPAGFSFPNYANYWVPLVDDRWVTMAGPGVWRTSRAARWLSIVGRLKDGVTVNQASAEMATLGSAQSPTAPGGATLSAHTEDYTAYAGHLYRSQIGQYLIAALVVQLLACANVAGLILARGTNRLAQTTLRAALGASRGRLLREMLTEGVLLAVGGIVIGLLFAYWLRPLVLAFIAPDWAQPAWWEFGFNGRVLAFTVTVGLGTMLLASLVPAWQSSNPRLMDRLRNSGPSQSGNAGSARLRSVVVVLQLAVTTALLVISGLAVKSVRAYQKIDLGIDPSEVAMFGVTFLGKNSPEQLARYYSELVRRLNALPGVEAAGFAYPMPGQYGRAVYTIAVEGRSMEETSFRVINSLITPGMLSVVKLPLLRGRDFDDRDNLKAEPAAMIDQVVAEKYFPGEDPIGKRIALEYPGMKTREWLTIVGIVGATRVHVLADQQPVVYRPISSPHGIISTYAFIRSKDGTGPTTTRALEAIRQVDANVSAMVVFGGSYERWIANVYWTQKLNSRVMTTFALLGFLIAMVGIYGLIAYAVGQRTRETGIRLALGATPLEVVHELTVSGLKLALVGIGMGLIATLVFAPAIASLAPKVSPRDPWVYLTVTGILGFVVLLATWLPARRAARVNPVIALRAE